MACHLTGNKPLLESMIPMKLGFWPGGWFNIKMPSYQYRKSHCGDKTILWLTVLSPQWNFLYWQDNIFILNQGPVFYHQSQTHLDAFPQHAHLWCVELTFLLHFPILVTGISDIGKSFTNINKSSHFLLMIAQVSVQLETNILLSVCQRQTICLWPCYLINLR